MAQPNAGAQPWGGGLRRIVAIHLAGEDLEAVRAAGARLTHALGDQVHLGLIYPRRTGEYRVDGTLAVEETALPQRSDTG